MDFIYSRIVLQHVNSRYAVRSYLSEFARVLAPGGLLVFQLPSHIPIRHRVQPRPRTYSLLRGVGVPQGPSCTAGCDYNPSGCAGLRKMSSEPTWSRTASRFFRPTPST